IEIAKNKQKTFPELVIVQEEKRGYGSAYLKGLSEAKYQYIFMADVDNTYDFGELPKFINKLEQGNDLVVGNRFCGNMEKKSMPWHHFYIGNPALSFFVKLFFNIKINDIHCGARAITKSALNKITLYTSGMEFASEMIIKSAKSNLRITEIPISYKKRLGESKLNSFADGWRHLRFILLYSPLVLFLLPGIILFFLGVFFTILFYFSNPNILGYQFYFHPMFISATMIIVGYQLMFFAGFARVYAITHLGEVDKRIEKILHYITIEKAGLAGLLMLFLGLSFLAYILIIWIKSDFSSINQVKNLITVLVLVVTGVQTISSAFMLSILGIKEK
ncbi:MAG: glycosyltransferase family 2 protein, partial [Planctomycetes bacterium]|nr:glycosyltransferase family 2 protein [Planctomycetota bacterium]